MKFVDGKNLKEKILNSELPVLVMFWSLDCLACDLANQNLFKLSDAYEDKMNFFKIDSQKNLDIIEIYNIDTLPTFIFFKENKIICRIEGYRKTFEIERKIREIL